MQAPVWVTRIVGWRWTPAFALVAGSLAFVGVVVAIIPDDLGAVGSGTSRLSRATRSRLATNVETTAETTKGPPSADDDERAWLAREEQRRAGLADTPTPGAPGNVVQSIFHSAPKVDLPVEPVDPTPQPPPPPPPPPPATATTFTLQTPPSRPAPEPPSEPQGITGQ